MKKEQHESLVKKILNRWSIELEAYQDAFGNQMPDRIDRIGNPLTFPEWLVLANDNQYNVISKEIIDEDISLSTMWFGYPELKFGTSIIKNDEINTLIISDNEDTAMQIHEKAGFLLDQKMWNFDGPNY